MVSKPQNVSMISKHDVRQCILGFSAAAVHPLPIQPECTHRRRRAPCSRPSGHGRHCPAARGASGRQSKAARIMTSVLRARALALALALGPAAASRRTSSGVQARRRAPAPSKLRARTAVDPSACLRAPSGGAAATGLAPARGPARLPGPLPPVKSVARGDANNCLDTGRGAAAPWSTSA